ncbi:MAG: helix-turn-helix transcriptional regulator [Candidatus Bathyarchaeota archaeon]|nr:helix-turn-helix transcriptional regulator [Candidatus Bathyarchaeota archaeon]
MKTGDLKQIILRLFGNREFYGYQVHKVLLSEDVKVEMSRLYRVLNEMRREELLEGRWEKSRIGPRRRVYRLGRRGREALNKILLEAIRTVHGFYGAYLMSLLPEVNVFDDIVRLFTDGSKVYENIVYIMTKYSRMHEVLISNIQSRLPQAKIFLVKPGQLELDLKLDNLFFLDGFYNDIPLKNDYADCMVVIGLPKLEYLERALKEWHRVLKSNGKLTILTPSILLERYEEPLTIGDFIEKHEHETIEKGEHVDKTVLEEQVNKYFNSIEEKSIVHITILRVSDPVQIER